jgi:hypothetical protein
LRYFTFVPLICESVEAQQVLYLVLFLNHVDGPDSSVKLLLCNEHLTFFVDLLRIFLECGIEPALKQTGGSLFDVNIFLSRGVVFGQNKLFLVKMFGL